MTKYETQGAGFKAHHICHWYKSNAFQRGSFKPSMFFIKNLSSAEEEPHFYYRNIEGGFKKKKSVYYLAKVGVSWSPASQEALMEPTWAGDCHLTELSAQFEERSRGIDGSPTPLLGASHQCMGVTGTRRVSL